MSETCETCGRPEPESTDCGCPPRYEALRDKIHLFPHEDSSKGCVTLQGILLEILGELEKLR